MSAATEHETDLERTVREEDAAHKTALADGTAKGEDPDTGKIFDVPRVAITVDDTDPTVIKISIAGGVELERGNKDQADFYNALKAGKDFDLNVSGHVAGQKKTHRHDSDGNVDAIVETKSLVVTDVQVIDS